MSLAACVRLGAVVSAHRGPLQLLAAGVRRSGGHAAVLAPSQAPAAVAAALSAPPRRLHGSAAPRRVDGDPPAGGPRGTVVSEEQVAAAISHEEVRSEVEEVRALVAAQVERAMGELAAAYGGRGGGGEGVDAHTPEISWMHTFYESPRPDLALAVVARVCSDVHTSPVTEARLVYFLAAMLRGAEQRTVGGFFETACMAPGLRADFLLALMRAVDTPFADACFERLVRSIERSAPGSFQHRFAVALQVRAWRYAFPVCGLVRIRVRARYSAPRGRGRTRGRCRSWQGASRGRTGCPRRRRSR